MALAGHQATVFAKASVAAVVAADEVDGINNIDYSPSVDLLDVTDFKDTSGAHKKLAALLDGSATLSGDLELADAPQTLLRASITGASVWLTFHFNSAAAAGSRGFQVECKMANFKIGAAVEDKVQFSIEAQFTGAATVDPAGP